MDITAKPQIELEQLTKVYKNTTAVDNISLAVNQGEFLSFLGPSGSGKTTTLMMIAGFETPTAGDIRVDEQSIIMIPPHKRNIGMVFQHYALFPHMSIYDNIAFPLQMRRMKKEEIRKRVQWALELVQLPDVAKRRPKQLSGGQQQRIALARALVFEPPILLLDEPLGALDRKLREELQIELKHIHNQLETTIIYVTHDQGEALTMSDRIAVFNEGEIVQLGTPADLYHYPKSRFVADFVGETNLLTGQVMSLQAQQCRMKTDDGLEAIGHVRESIEQQTKSVTFSIRPESILIGERAKNKNNVFTGVVEDSLYLGETTKFRVQLGDATVLTVKWFNRLGEQQIAPGHEITIGWNVEDMLLVDSSSATVALEN